MVDGMAAEEYTVTLPEELTEAVRAEIGPGASAAMSSRP